MTAPALALNVEVVNDSSQKPQNVFLTLHGGESSDGQLKNNEPKQLSQINNSTFSIGQISAGRLYVSFGGGYPGEEAEEAPTRYDKIEFTNPGVANLTAVDFFAIPFDLQALDSVGGQVGDALTYRCFTSTVLEGLRAIGPTAQTAEVKSPAAQFLRFRSPQHAPLSFPSMEMYVQSMVGQTIEVNDSFGKEGIVTRNLHYKGTFQLDGSIALEGTITPEHESATTGEALSIEGAGLKGAAGKPSAIYTGNGAYTVGAKAASVGENNEYSVIYRDVVAGFALGYWGGKYGNNAERSESGWIGQPDFAAARKGGEGFVAYDQYAARIGEYSYAYGYSFHDLGPSPVTVPLDSEVATLRLTIDPDQGPATRGCSGESTPAAPAPPQLPARGHRHRAHPAPRAKPPAAASGQVKVTIDSGTVKLDKRGRALFTLGCGGDPCKGELALIAMLRSPGRPGASRRLAHGGARTASRHGPRRIAHATPVLLGHIEFAIGEGKAQRVWVQISKRGRRAIEHARGRRLRVLAQALVGPRSKPTLASQRSVLLKGRVPPRHARHR